MADVRCPMCGKPNPADQEVCQFCQARLKPLAAPSQDNLSQTSGTPPSVPPFIPDEEDADWLSDLRQEETGFPAGEELSLSSEGEGADEEGELPDWLSRLQGESQDYPQEEARQAQPADDTLPDWLSALPPAEPEQAEAQFEPQPPPEAETAPDWLSSPGSAAEADLPDWLTELGPAIPAEADVLGVDQEESTAGEPEETLPDWLAQPGAGKAEEILGLEPEAAAAITASGEEAIPAEVGELPDWLTSLKPIEEAETGEQPEVPEWLAESEREARSFAIPEEPLPAAEEAGPPGEEPSEEAAPAEQAPDWLGELVAASKVSAFTLDEPAPSLQDTEQPEELPDWLSSLAAETSRPEASSPTPALIFDEEEAEAFATGQPLEIGDEAEYLTTLPDWVSQVKAEEPPSEEVKAEEESGLAPAELPGWLEAMRPVEAATAALAFTPEKDEHIESAGPLARLRGVLQTESAVIRPHKVQPYSVRLQVTEEQSARVALLQELLADENKPKALPSPPVITPQYIFRLVIALALLVPILLMIWVGGGLTPLPDPAQLPAGVMDMHSQINTISDGAPVLVAFDYDAGYSSEMETTAAAALSDLIEGGAYLTLVSTKPAGPALGERLTRALTGQPAYANLGYIPGGSVGLLSFAEDPRRAVPYTLDSVDIWAASPLDQVTAISDFGLILVLTEDPDTARAWIEQVQPFLKEKGTPMLMVISAQAEALVLPYYQTNPKQISGLLAGVQGSAAYESLSGAGRASEQWDAYSAGLFVSVLIVLVGAFISGGAGMLGRNKKGKDQSQA